MSDDGTTTTPGAALETDRWVGLAGVALCFVAFGTLVRQPALILVGAVGVGYELYVRYDDAPVADLAVERLVSDRNPDPGTEVTVTVRAENRSGGSIADLRLVDGVPDGLEATEGLARVATALQDGATVEFSYTVRATRGSHEWGPLRAITRNPSGSRERETEIAVETELTCVPTLDAGSDLPLRGLTTQYHGRVPTDVGGSGVEFYATREYRHGDPLRRVDWNRRARTGEMATLELREERAATVVLLVDAREVAYVADSPSGDTAVDRSVTAAGRAFSALQAGGDRVGIAALSPAADCWLPPGTGTHHAARARELLATHDAFASTPTDETLYTALWFRRFRRRLSADAQVVFFSPIADDYAATLARQIDANGHLVTVVSPDVTRSDTPGHAIARFERDHRIRKLRSGGIRVVEWDRDESFPAAVAGSQRRWG